MVRIPLVRNSNSQHKNHSRYTEIANTSLPSSRTRHNLKTLLFSSFAFFLAGTATFFSMKNTPETAAADLSKWDAGNIMSDEVMGDYNSMTTAQIQSFLKSKNPCNNTNVGLAKTYSSYSYHIKDGHFVCMADESFNGKSAAEIIHEAAQDYRINPKVIIVLLQKEQGLVTDTWPNSLQYRSATGYGCPDTGACDSQYYGLRNQIRQAASLFRSVLDGGWSNYAVGRHNIQYSPNSSCGSSSVYVQNRATSALYRYTPYQPNAASLNAGYGSGDSCSSYGNRNFYQYYVDWFGDTRTKSATTQSAPKTIHSLDDISQSVPEGTYTFGSSHNANFVADVSGASKNSSAKVQLYRANGTVAQQWRLTYNPDHTYTFINPNSGKALDITGANMVNGTQLQQYDSNNTCAQRWVFIPNGDYYWIASSCDTNYVIDLSNGNISNGAKLQIWKKDNTKNQLWKMTTTSGVSIKKPAQIISDGVYTMYSNIGNNQVLEIGGASTAIGKETQTWASNGTITQQWQFKYNSSDGTYTITNSNSRLDLDLSGAEAYNKNKIHQWTPNGTLAQKWFIIPDGDSFQILSGVNINYALDVDGARNDNGTVVSLYQSNGTKAQTWKLVKNNDVELGSGNYHIETKLKANMYADIENGSTSNAAQAQIYEKDGTSVQNWYISKESDGTYRFKNLKSGKYLDVDSAIMENGHKIQIYSENLNGCMQKWLVTNENGSYKIASSCNKDYVLDVSGANASNGTKIQLYKSNDTNAQRWNFIPY
ncbi:MAG: RICIN domain-containing protein [Candidatus Saccharibacteria bacterium]|nr:RICIN domain-containing protein [Candidatus Saccharibacteria bacterium]